MENNPAPPAQQPAAENAEQMENQQDLNALLQLAEYHALRPPPGPRPVYDGQIPFEQFMEQFEAYLDQTAINAQDANHAALVLREFKATLRPPMTQARILIPEANRNDWAYVKQFFFTYYGTAHADEQARRLLGSQQQKPGEALVSFAVRIRILVDKAYSNATEAVRRREAVTWFVTQLREPLKSRLSVELRNNPDWTISEALERANALRSEMGSSSTGACRTRRSRELLPHSSSTCPKASSPPPPQQQRPP